MAARTISFSDILRKVREITDIYGTEPSRANFFTALLHIHSEVSETYETERKSMSVRTQKLDLADIFITWLEACHMAGLSDNEIIEMLDNRIPKAKRLAKKIWDLHEDVKKEGESRGYKFI